MKTLFLRLISLLAFFHAADVGAQAFVVKRDLRGERLVFDGTAFVPFEQRSGNEEVFYVKLRNPDPRGEFVRVTAKQPVSLFINNQLAGTFKSAIFPIDSLARAAGADDLVLAAYFNEQDINDISTELLSATTTKQVEGHDKRRPYFFHDFVIFGALVLLIMIAVIVRMNPKLASDYFSVPRIFSFREMDDAQIYTRIGSSSNILFYVFCSLLLGFYLMVIFHFVTTVYPVSHLFQSASFVGAMFDWLKLSVLMLGLLLLKIILVVGFSSLFGMAEVAGIHFFNWVRIIVVFFGILSAFLIIYFIWYGQDVSLLSAMLRLLAWIIAGWIVLIFLKLTSKSKASMFHLFSYICATELIPFLFIIRVLYK
jgi:hypothetical protein